MRMIGSLPEEQAARSFGDYLLTLGIDHAIDEARDGWAVWIKEEDQFDQARREFEQYASNPTDARYRNVALEASAIRSRQARREKRLRENYVDVRTNWARGVRGAHPLVYVLVALSVVVTLATWANNNLHGVLWQYLAFAPLYVPPDTGVVEKLQVMAPWQAWRFITPIFLHGSVLHLLFNMLWLVDLGGLIEHRKGTRTLILLVLVSALLSNFAQHLWSGPAFGGMSGVVYALFGYVWMKSRYQPQEQLDLHENTAIIMIVWLVVCMTGLVGPVANAAHVGGLVVGVVVGGAAYWGRRLKRRR